MKILVDDVAIKPSDDEGAQLMSLSKFVFIAFFLTCGGPFGLDNAVQSGGILLTVIGIVILPFVWSLPQALMTAELSSMINVNGGSIIWVWRGLGTSAGVANAYVSTISCWVDLCLYPSKMIDYLPFRLPPAHAYVAKIVILTIASLFNTVGLSAVGTVSCIIMVIMLSVFIVEIPFALPLVSSVDYTLMPDQMNWAFLLSVLLWANSGWDSLSNFAGEVKNPRRTYPLGIALSMMIGTLAYLTSIVVGYTLLPDPSRWGSDAFVVAAAAATGPGTWLPIWASLSAVVGNFGQLLVCMAASSRQMWAMGGPCKDQGLTMRTLPKQVGSLSSRFGTPTTALALQLVITSVLSFWSFEPLVEFLALLNCVNLAMEFGAFMALRYREPSSARPFLVPGGMLGAWVITGLKTAVLLFIIITVFVEDPLVVVAAVAVNVGIGGVAYWAGDAQATSCEDGCCCDDVPSCSYC